jgi:hypothetical protein
MRCDNCKLNVEPWELHKLDGKSVCIFCYEEMSTTTARGEPTACVSCGGILELYEFEANGRTERTLFCPACYCYQEIKPVMAKALSAEESKK